MIIDEIKRKLGQQAWHTLASGSDYGGSLRTPAGFLCCSPTPRCRSCPHRVVSLTPYSFHSSMGRSVVDVALMTVVQTSSDKCSCFWGVFGISENRDLDLCVVHEVLKLLTIFTTLTPMVTG